MARSAMLHFLAVCLFWHAEGVSSSDGQGQEYFPLSGGIREGVKVTIKADKVNTQGVLDFLTPSREIALKWLMDVENKQVSRTGKDQAAQTWGGWGLNAEVPIALEFYRTKSTFQVSVGTNGIDPIRFPWFDFNVQGAGLMTHVSVHDGFENVEVVQSRPTCTTVCDSTECGAGGCQGDDGTACYSTNEDTCFSHTDTSVLELALSCCDGLPKGMSINDDHSGKWVQLTRNTNFIERACTAYNTETKSCAEIAGKKGQITGVNASTGSYTVWVPSAVQRAHDYDVDVSTFTLPAVTLQLSMQADRRYVRLDDGQTIWVNDFKVDPHNALIYQSTTVAESKNVSKGWFIHMIAYKVGFPEVWRWFDYSLDDEEIIKTNKHVVDVVLTDEVIPAPTCNNDLNFADLTNDLTCDNYTDSYCSLNGEATDLWCKLFSKRGKQCKLREFKDGGLSPAHQCCACGGGNVTAPQDAMPEPSEAATKVFNM